jgi:predicted Zn-dependent protease
VGTQLISLRFSRDDEIEADLVGLELAARGAFVPEASVSLWEKMGKASGGAGGGPGFLSTHPTGPDRIRRLQENVPRVRGLYQQASGRR